MSIVTPDPVSPARPPSQREKLLTSLWQLLCGSWELGPILIVATFFRVYGDENAFFSDDQASMWRLARDAATHHVLLASSNRSSLGILHGYFISYFLMPVAALTANPIWGAVETGLFNVLGILLTYIFIRRYYGRLIGALAAALYAIGTVIVLYNRYIWQPNLVPPLVVAFMFCLYWGAVERRRGWFFPAIVLLGLLYETHESSVLMALPLLVAFCLASVKTIRWREVFLAMLALLIIFFPYMVWLRASNYADILTLLRSSSAPKMAPMINGNIFLFYMFFMSPFVSNLMYFTGSYMSDPSLFVGILPSDPRGVLSGGGFLVDGVRAFLSVVFFIEPVLCLGGVLVIVRALFLGQRSFKVREPSRGMRKIGSWLKDWGWSISHDPVKRGYVLLLVWQGVLPLLLVRNSVPLYTHYVIYLFPGPYILMALCLGKAFTWKSKRLMGWHRVTRPLACVLTIIVLCGYLLGTTGAVIDIAHGNFDSSLNQPRYSTDVPSLRNAVMDVDRIAHAHGIRRIYIAANLGISESLQYVARDIHTPTTLFDATHCLVLPSEKIGSVAYLVSPYDVLVDPLLQQYTNATLISQPPRAGGASFRIYILSAKPAPSHPQLVYKNNLRLLDAQARRFDIPTDMGKQSWMVSRWQFVQSKAPRWGTTYEYNFAGQFLGQIPPSGHAQDAQCALTQMFAGDQLLTAFAFASSDTPTPAQVTMNTIYIETRPWLLQAGPLQFQTYKTTRTAYVKLRTVNGLRDVIVPG